MEEVLLRAEKKLTLEIKKFVNTLKAHSLSGWKVGNRNKILPFGLTLATLMKDMNFRGSSLRSYV